MKIFKSLMSQKKRLGVLVVWFGLACAFVVAFDLLIVPPRLFLSMMKVHLFTIVLAAVIAVLYTYSGIDRQRKTVEWTIQAFRDTSKQQRLYLIVILLWCLGFMAWITGGFFLLSEIGIPILIFMFLVAARDVVEWYEELAANSLGKGLLALGFAISSTIAYGIASQHIAGIVHVTPTNFTKSVVLVAILEIPLLLSIAALICAALLISTSSLIMAASVLPGVSAVVSLFRKDRPIHESIRFLLVTRLFQITLLVLVGFALYSTFKQKAGEYEKFILAQARNIVYELDMYPGTECKLDAGFKLAPLGDSRFLVGTRDISGYVRFEPPMKCGD